MEFNDDEMFSPDGNKFPNYWKMFRTFTIGDLKTGATEQVAKDPTGQKYQGFMMKNVNELLACYIHGLQNGIKESIKVSFEQFCTFVYVVTISKSVKQKTDSLKPEPMTPKKSELDNLYNDDKIKNEIDDIYKDLGME